MAPLFLPDNFPMEKSLLCSESAWLLGRSRCHLQQRKATAGQLDELAQELGATCATQRCEAMVGVVFMGFWCFFQVKLWDSYR